MVIASRLHLQVENSFLRRFGAVPQRPPDVCWSGSVRSRLALPLLVSLIPLPHWCSFYLTAHFWCCLPSSIATDTEYPKASPQGLPCESSASHFDWKIPGFPSVSLAVLHKWLILCLLPLMGFLYPLFPWDCELHYDDLMLQCWPKNNIWSQIIGQNDGWKHKSLHQVCLHLPVCCCNRNSTSSAAPCPLLPYSFKVNEDKLVPTLRPPSGLV